MNSYKKVEEDLFEYFKLLTLNTEKYLIIDLIKVRQQITTNFMSILETFLSNLRLFYDKIW